MIEGKDAVMADILTCSMRLVSISVAWLAFGAFTQRWLCLALPVHRSFIALTADLACELT